MIPDNPSNNNPFIYRILDSLGIAHQVAPVNHQHDMLIGQTIRIIINGNEIELEISDLPNILRALSNPDSTPTQDSDKLITSAAVYAALAGKQNTLTFDPTPTADSQNPVTSGGVKTALDSKADASAMTAALAEKQDTLPFDTTPTLNSNNPVTSSGIRIAIEEKYEGIMPVVRELGTGDSIDLDGESIGVHSLKRYIVKNNYDSEYEIPFEDIFFSGTLPVHTSGTSSVTIPNGAYVMASVFRMNSSEHEHLNCYFVLLEGIFTS